MTSVFEKENIGYVLDLAKGCALFRKQSASGKCCWRRAVSADHGLCVHIAS